MRAPPPPSAFVAVVSKSAALSLLPGHRVSGNVALYQIRPSQGAAETASLGPIVERLAPADGCIFRDGRLNLLKVVIQLRAEAAAINAIARGRST
jgi:hypothetical protein